MTFHQRAHKKANGSTANKYGHLMSPRLSVGFDRGTFHKLANMAAKRGIPAGAVVREAVDGYLEKILEPQLPLEPPGVAPLAPDDEPPLPFDAPPADGATGY